MPLPNGVKIWLPTSILPHFAAVTHPVDLSVRDGDITFKFQWHIAAEWLELAQ